MYSVIDDKQHKHDTTLLTNRNIWPPPPGAYKCRITNCEKVWYKVSSSRNKWPRKCVQNVGEILGEFYIPPIILFINVNSFIFRNIAEWNNGPVSCYYAQAKQLSDDQ